MKATYTILYFLSGLIFLSAMLGSTLFKPMFDLISEKTIEASGFRKSYLESVDDKIDDLVFKSRQVELQIEKLKKFFSSDKVDETQYQKEKGEMLEKALYNPLVGMFNFGYRVIFTFIAFIILLFAVIFHITYRSLDLRRRVRRLEELVLAKRH